jgi:hypothetical protein
MSTEQYRQMLAGLIDPQQKLELTDREVVRHTAIDFVACLPRIFGPELDRMTLWDRIGSAVQVAFSKTVDDDHEFFISEVCRHIMAGTAAARCEELNTVLQRVTAWEAEQRVAWMQYLASHLPVVLINARAEWEKVKKGGGN